MDTKALHFLVAVVESGSMSGAARQLGTTRSNISRRLKALEQSMKAQLFRRTTRRVEPTQIGWALYEHAARITQELAALRDTVDDLGRTLRGHLRVSVPTGLGQLVLGDLLLEFAQAHPEVSLQLTFSNRVVDLVAEEIDVAVRVASSPPEAYVARDLGEVRWALCAAPRYLQQIGLPQRVEDLARGSFVSTPVHGNRLLLKLVCGKQRSELELRPRVQAVDMLFLKRAALAGLGYAVLPMYTVEEELRTGSLQQVLPEHSVVVDALGDRLYLITTPSLYPTLATRALIDFLRRRFQETSILR